jgi:hypothetical protein
MAYANTQDGYHICLNCVTEEEKEKFYPLYHSDLYDYKYADYELGLADEPNQPSCDKCLNPIEFEGD